MVSRKFAIPFGLGLLVAAYLAGYWPEHNQNQALTARLASVESELTAVRAERGVARLLGELLSLSQLVSRQDFGQAQVISSRFFDGVRAEAAGSAEPRFRTALAGILQLRDAVTAGLTRADPSTGATLTEIQLRLRAALGYPIPAEVMPDGRSIEGLSAPASDRVHPPAAAAARHEPEPGRAGTSRQDSPRGEPPDD